MPPTRTIYTYEPLSQPVTKQDIDRYRNADPSNRRTIGTWFTWFFLAIIFFGLMASTIAIVQSGKPELLLSQLPTNIFWVGVMLLIWVMSRTRIAEYVRLSRFAEANGLVFRRSTKNPAHRGMIFGIGHSRMAGPQLLRTQGEQPFEIGNYVYTTGSGKSSQTYSFVYIAIPLERNVPHMVLDAKANNAKFFGLEMSSLPISLNGSQKLSLEGDFDKHFTLYAPKEYERDALYVVTPDLMALLIDTSANFDLETVDNVLYVYRRGVLQFNNPAALAQLFRIIETVGAKTVTQTDYYADAQVGNRAIDQVAVGGRRLRKKIAWGPVVIVLVISLGFFLYPLLVIISTAGK